MILSHEDTQGSDMFSFFKEDSNCKELNFFHFKELQTIQ